MGEFMSIDSMPMGGNFDMGRVVAATFGAAKQHIVTFLIAGVLLTGLPQIVAVMGMKGVDPVAAATNPLLVVSNPMYWIGIFLTIVGGYMFQALVIYTVAEGHRGRETPLPVALTVAFKSVIPLFLLALLATLGMTVGMILLIVPGIILAVMWSVAIPALVTEKIGPIAALGRSRALTKGSRWGIFGLVLVAVILSYVLALGIYGFNFAAMSAASTNPGVIQVTGSIIVGALSATLYGCGAAAIYSELRMIKEGVSNSELAAAFD